MHVQQVKFMEFSNFGHPRRQRQIVGWKLEERIAGDMNLVIVDAVVPSAEPERLRIGNEVHLMSERGQFDAQFRGHHARAAVGGITGNANAHKPFSVRNFRPTLTWTLRKAWKMQ